MPALLPAEFLDSSSEDEGDADDDVPEDSKPRQGKKGPKRIKLESTEQPDSRPRRRRRHGDGEGQGEGEKRPVRDRRVGQTLYRVLPAAPSSGERQLPPKMDNRACYRKQQLLARGRATQPRKSTGFLVQRRR